MLRSNNELRDESHDRMLVFEMKLSSLLDYVNNLERPISKLETTSHLMDPETQLDKYGPVAAVNFLYVLASETGNRHERPCYFIAFAISDHIPTNVFRD